MRYGPIADDAVEERMLRSSRSPRVLLDTFMPLVQASALMAAARSGVFEALRDGPRTPADLASTLAVEPETLDLVLRVLSASDYVTRDDQGRFGLSPVARATLLEDSPDRLTAWVSMIDMWWAKFAEMGELLRTGQGFELHSHLRDPAAWATYQAAMLENARRMAPLVAAAVPVRAGATRLLDIAGSHGLFGASIARAHPPMRSEVLDLPDAVEHARRLAVAEGIDDVVTHRAGDALTTDLGSDRDVVFLGNILHHLSPEQIVELLSRVRAAMSPEGTVAVWEVRQPDADETPDVGDAFALFFRLTSSARCYRTSEFTSWLAGAGFTDVQVQPLPVGRSLVLVTGRA